MLRSIHFRFILVNVLVVIVSISLTTVLASRMTGSEYRRIQDIGDRAGQDRLVAMLTDVYRASGSWRDVQATVEQMSAVTGERISVVDVSGTVVGDSAGEMIGRSYPLHRLPPFGKIFVNGAYVGTVVTDPSLVQRPPKPDSFEVTLNRMMLISASAAGIVAILFTFLISRRVTQPVEELTAAARKMEKGDLSVRVDVHSRDEIGQLGQAFNAMADGLSRMEQLRRNMVNDVAHELRTPLTNLRGYLEAAREGVVAPDAGFVENLYEETMLLNRLTDDLRDLSLVEARQLRLERQPVDVGALARAAVDAIRLQADARGVGVGAEIAADLPPADADPSRVAQVLRNLLNNALDFTPEGGRVTVGAGVEGNAIRVDVRDTGVGIAPEQLPLIFERFYRVDPSRTRSTGGAGLGLTIVKNLVEAHGGRVWAESTPGSGSTFSFTLPLATQAG